MLILSRQLLFIFFDTMIDLGLKRISQLIFPSTLRWKAIHVCCLIAFTSHLLTCHQVAGTNGKVLTLYLSLAHPPPPHKDRAPSAPTWPLLYMHPESVSAVLRVHIS
jgi:hypothetical protein